MNTVYQILKLVGHYNEYGATHHRLAQTVYDDNIVIRSSIQ